ncbi:MAG: ABC transporter ATP-binding protein, partial [Xenophilus sp.]
MVAVRLENVSKRYQDQFAVRDADLAVEQGEFVSLLGASGSGKTTCLRMVGGFVLPTQGRILFGEQDVTQVPAHRRDIGMVFQQYALFPHLTVAQNIAFGLKVRRLARQEIQRKVQDALRLVRLEALSGRYPAQLSGGQKQRVALARAVVINPRLLLLDEPLGALDLKLREELQVEIRRIQRELQITAIFVTHDQNEALTLSDRIAVMHEGRIAQIGSPAEIYRRPNSAYVANFIGRTNLLQASVIDHRDGRLHLRHADGDFTVQAAHVHGGGADFRAGERVTLGFRPESLHADAEDTNSLQLQVRERAFQGEGWLLTCSSPSGQDIAVRLGAGTALPDVGENIRLGVRSED